MLPMPQVWKELQGSIFLNLGLSGDAIEKYRGVANNVHQSPNTETRIIPLASDNVLLSLPKWPLPPAMTKPLQTSKSACLSGFASASF